MDNSEKLRQEAQNLYAQFTALATQAHNIPNHKGGKAERDALMEKATPFREQSLIASKNADEQLIKAYRLGTPAQYNEGVAGYQANLDRAKAANDAEAIEKYGRILIGLKASGFPTQAKVDLAVQKLYDSFKIPTYTNDNAAKAGYDKADQMVKAETDPIRKAALEKGRDQIGLDRFNKFYTPAEKTAIKADYTKKLAAATARKDAHTMAYYKFYLNGIK